MSVPAFAHSLWNSSPRMTGSRTSSTRQEEASGRCLLRNSSAEPKSSTYRPTDFEQALQRSAHGGVVVDDEHDGSTPSCFARRVSIVMVPRVRSLLCPF